MKQPKIPRDWYEHAAQELNETMGLEPAIDLDADDEIKDLVEYAGEFVEPDDCYTLITWLCLGYQDAVFMLFSKEKFKEHESRSV